MANNKKIFTIEINGLTESVKSVDALQEKIMDLEKRIKSLGKSGGGGKKVLLEVDGDAEYNKLLAERQKLLKAVKTELGNTNKNAKEYKQETKEMVALLEKERNATNGYANTLKGLKQELKDCKEEIQNIDFKSEHYQEVEERIASITDKLKEYEAKQKTFSRNVGNYPGKEIEQSSYEKVKELYNNLKQLNPVIDEIESKIKNNESIDFNWLKNVISEEDLNALVQLQDRMAKTSVGVTSEMHRMQQQGLKPITDGFKRLNGQVVLADNQLKTQLQRTINGQLYTWENLTAAVGDLEDKLYQLAAYGKKDTEQFKTFAKVAAELKTQLRQVDYEIDSMVESSKGINKMVSMTQGFTAIAQGAVGIGQLFGMDSENAMKGIQTMTALQGVASALQTIQEQIKQGTAFGKTMESWINKLTLFTVGLEAAKGKWFDLLKAMNKDIPKIDIFSEDEQNLYDNITKQQNIAIRSTRKLRKEYAELHKAIVDLGGEVNGGGTTGILAGVLDRVGDANTNPDSAIKDRKDEILELWERAKGFSNEVNNLLSNDKASLWQKAKATILDYAEGLGLISSTAPKAANGLKLIGTALKGLMKATIILAIVQAVIELIGWISDLVGKIYQWVVGNDKLVNGLNKVETEVNLVNKSIDRYIKNLEYLRDTNKLWVTDTEMATLKLEKLERELLKAAVALKEFSNIKGNGESLLENLTNGDTWFQDSVDSIEDFRKRYEALQKAVESGKDVTSVSGGNWFQQLWSTKSDAKADLGEMQIAIIKDLQNTIDNLDLSKGTEEIRRLYELLQDPMYASSLENVENLFPEEEWAQVLKKRVEQIQTMYEQFDDAAKESVKIRLEEEERLTKELVDYQKNVAKQVRDNNTEAIEDEYERELQALKNAKRDELDAAQGNLELIVSINKKYNRLEMDMLKKHQEDKLKELEESEWDITDILRRIRDNRLSAEEESLDKHLQEIENERNDAIEDAYKEAEEAAKEGHNLTELYNELALSINIKYDALVKKEKEQYYQDLLDMYEDYERAMQEVQMQYRANGLDDKSSDADIRYNQKLNSSNSSYDFNGNFIQEEKKFNQERLKIELEYLEDKKKLDEEYAKFDKDDASQQEQIRYEDALRKLKDFKEEGKATEEEYNALVEKEEELHMQQMSMIDSKYNNDLTTINNQYLNDRKSTISSSLAENASLYQEYANEVNDIMSNVGRDINAFGVLDYGKTKEQMEKAKETVVEGVNAIDAELKNLERKRKSGEMSFIDYKQAKEELEQTKKTLEDQGKDITEGLDNLIKEVCSQWKGLVDSWVSQISSLLSTMNDTQMILIDNQLAEIEHQLEIQEEAYEKAEEAAEAHKDKMDSIEDELADARGSRRQFLIDTLAAQQAAYLEDVAAKEKAEQEKEKLEQKQKALEKKRAEQEKKAKVQQAVINTYMAVSNALAVQPWFVGLALSAVALALGLKNVSAIKSTPIYEDGGVIQGARHSQGGVKVLGGQAEVEGGEFITNRKSTAANLPLLTYINDKKREVTAEDLFNFFNNGTPTVKSKLTRKFASGGQLPTTDGSEVNRVMSVSDTNEGNKTYIVQVTDIINAQKNLEKVQVLSGLVNDK